MDESSNDVSCYGFLNKSLKALQFSKKFNISVKNTLNLRLYKNRIRNTNVTITYNFTVYLMVYVGEYYCQK